MSQFFGSGAVPAVCVQIRFSNLANNSLGRVNLLFLSFLSILSFFWVGCSPVFQTRKPTRPIYERKTPQKSLISSSKSALKVYTPTHVTSKRTSPSLVISRSHRHRRHEKRKVAFAHHTSSKTSPKEDSNNQFRPTSISDLLDDGHNYEGTLLAIVSSSRLQQKEPLPNFKTSLPNIEKKTLPSSQPPSHKKRQCRRCRGKKRCRCPRPIPEVSPRTIRRLVLRLQPVIFRRSPIDPEKFIEPHQPISIAPKRQKPLTIPLPKDRRFRWVIRKYGTRYWGFTWSILKNRGRFEKQMRRHLRSIGVPEELFLIPGIESNYQVRLISPVGAVGIWQFMYKTARRFKLRVTPWYDERRHIRKATLGGGRYLRELYRHFGKWEFAIAAYNAGPWLMERALKRCPNMTFWKMRLRRCGLPWETKEYVARFFAMLYFLRHNPRPDKPINPLPPVILASAKTKGPVSLFQVSQAIGLPLEKLHFYNSELSSWATPPRQNYPLLVPPQYLPKLKAFLAHPKGRYRLHSLPVQPGSSLRRIARRFGLTEQELATFNRLKPGTIPPYRHYLIIPLPPHKMRWRRTYRVRRFLEQFVKEVKAYRWRYPTGWRIRRRGRCHRVKKGQTLWSIARRYGMSRYRIKLYNPSVSQVKPGDWVRLRRNASCGKKHHRKSSLSS